MTRFIEENGALIWTLGWSGVIVFVALLGGGS